MYPPRRASDTWRLSCAEGVEGQCLARDASRRDRGRARTRHRSSLGSLSRRPRVARCHCGDRTPVCPRLQECPLNPSGSALSSRRGGGGNLEPARYFLATLPALPMRPPAGRGPCTGRPDQKASRASCRGRGVRRSDAMRPVSGARSYRRSRSSNRMISFPRANTCRVSSKKHRIARDGNALQLLDVLWEAGNSTSRNKVQRKARAHCSGAMSIVAAARTA